MTEELCEANLYIISDQVFLCAYNKGHEGDHALQIHNDDAGKIRIFWENHDPTFDPVKCENCKETVAWNETTICNHDECTTDGCIRCFECQICLYDYCLTHMVLHTLDQTCNAEWETEEGDWIIPLQAKVGIEKGGYYARVVGMDGCITQGDDIKELRENLQDAVNSWLDIENKLFSFKLDFVSSEDFLT